VKNLVKVVVIANLSHIVTKYPLDFGQAQIMPVTFAWWLIYSLLFRWEKMDLGCLKRGEKHLKLRWRM